MAVNALLVLRYGVQGRQLPMVLAGMVIVLLAGALACTGAHRGRQLAHETPAAPHWSLIAAAASAVLLAVLCAAWSLVFAESNPRITTNHFSCASTAHMLAAPSTQTAAGDPHARTAHDSANRRLHGPCRGRRNCGNGLRTNVGLKWPTVPCLATGRAI